MSLQIEIDNAIRELVKNKILNGEITVSEIAAQVGLSIASVYQRIEGYKKFDLRFLDWVVSKWGAEINVYLKSIIILTEPFLISSEQIDFLKKADKILL